MPSSSELYVLNKLSELVQRCGVSPVDPELYFSYVDRTYDPTKPPSNQEPEYILSRLDLEYGDDADDAKRQKVYSLLGLEKPYRAFSSLEEALDAVEQALSLAPRARTR